MKPINQEEIKERLESIIESCIRTEYDLDEDSNEIPFDLFDKDHAIELLIKLINEIHDKHN